MVVAAKMQNMLRFLPCPVAGRPLWQPASSSGAHWAASGAPPAAQEGPACPCGHRPMPGQTVAKHGLLHGRISWPSQIPDKNKMLKVQRYIKKTALHYERK